MTENLRIICRYEGYGALKTPLSAKEDTLWEEPKRVSLSLKCMFDHLYKHGLCTNISQRLLNRFLDKESSIQQRSAQPKDIRCSARLIQALLF